MSALKWRRAWGKCCRTEVTDAGMFGTWLLFPSSQAAGRRRKGSSPQPRHTRTHSTSLSRFATEVQNPRLPRPTIFLEIVLRPTGKIGPMSEPLDIHIWKVIGVHILKTRGVSVNKMRYKCENRFEKERFSFIEANDVWPCVRKTVILFRFLNLLIFYF